ncbi:MAG: threonylcarbamoyl-AMP synthase [Desulfarculus sp.]|nr:threonylcarbamoyl-AMP synthase [Desulfarculus sp.]
MPATVIHLDPRHPDPAALARAAGVLAGGGLIVYPTETLYGIAADYRSAAALERLAALKGRQANKPFPLILAHAAEAEALAVAIPPQAHDLMDRFWPGPLTLVLSARPGLHPLLLSDQGGVGVRVSSHPVAAGLARALSRAVTATSANLAGRPAASRVEDLASALVAGVDLVLDAGPTPGGPPSTVLDCRGWPPRLLRAGALSLQALGLEPPTSRPEC